MSHRLYSYVGTISMLPYQNEPYADLILHCSCQEEIAPVKLTITGPLYEYVRERDLTDNEERYINATWYYDSNLYIRRIEIPSCDDRRPAKVIAMDEPWPTEKLVVFGPQEFISTSMPEPLNDDAYWRYRQWLTNWKLSHN